MLKQLSIFAENIKGKMQKVTGILLEEDINILGSVTNDSAEYGIIRMVVSKPEQALEALTKDFIQAKETIFPFVPEYHLTPNRTLRAQPSMYVLGF